MLQGGGPAIYRAGNKGAFRGGEGALKVSFCSDASDNSGQQLLLTDSPPNCFSTVSGQRILGEFLLEERGRAPVRIGRFQKEPPSQTDACGSSARFPVP